MTDDTLCSLSAGVLFIHVDRVEVAGHLAKEGDIIAGQRTLKLGALTELDFAVGPILEKVRHGGAPEAGRRADAVRQ